VFGFDPIQQVIHEDDLGLAFERALEPKVRGVFNVTGPGEVPLHVLIEEAGASPVPIPEALISLIKGRLGFPEIPRGAIEYLKYPCTVDGTRFRKATGFAPAFGLVETLRSVPRREQRFTART
jgi:UDP-glucose 4-epimerase